MFTPLSLGNLIAVHFWAFVAFHYYFIMVIVVRLLLNVVSTIDVVLWLLFGVSIVLDVKGEFVRFVSGGGRRRRFKIKYMLVDFDGHGGLLWFHAVVGIHSLLFLERMCVRIVSSGIYQSVTFLRAGTLSYDIDVFGVAGTITTY